MFRYLVLGLLRDGKPRHGYALMKEYRERSGIEMNTGSFYRELSRLVTDGLVRIARPESDVRRTPYVILDAGRALFDRWVSSPMASLLGGADDELGTRAVFLGLADRERMRAAIVDWQEQLWIHGKGLERLRAGGSPAEDADAMPVLQALLARRQRHVAVDIEFAGELLAAFDAWWSGRTAPAPRPPARAPRETGEARRARGGDPSGRGAPAGR